MNKSQIKLLSKLIDHTKLSPDTTVSDIEKICNEAKIYGFCSVCVNPFYVPVAKKFLEGSDIKVGAAIGFPLGQNALATKLFETKLAIKEGATEIDMVINIAALKNLDLNACLLEVNTIKGICGNIILKVIVETCLLSTYQKEFAAKMVLNSDADFIKTSTGFSTGGATIEDIKIFKRIVQNNKMIKASGGIKTAKDFLTMIELGANRIGTSSGTKIIDQLINQNKMGK